MSKRIFCTHKTWKFQRVPTNELANVRKLFDSKDWEKLLTLFLKYKVVTGMECRACNNRTKILEWTGYAYEMGWLI